MLDATLRPRCFDCLSMADAYSLPSHVEADQPVQLAILFCRLRVTLRCQVEVVWYQLSSCTFLARRCHVLQCLLKTDTPESACRRGN